MAKSLEEIRADIAARKAKPAETTSVMPTSSEDQANHELNSLPGHTNGAGPEPTAERRRDVPRETRDVPRRHSRGQGTPRDEKELPHSVEAEHGVIGSMMDRSQSKAAIAKAKEALKPESFFVPANAMMFTDLCEMDAAGIAIDLVTFGEYLRKVGHEEKVGGPARVTSILTSVPSAANIAYYVDIVREKHQRREAIKAGLEQARMAADESEEVVEVIEVGQRRLEAVRALSAERMEEVEDFAFQSLLAFDPRNDMTQLVGNRYLCQGFTCLWAGGAGYGKSSLEMQLAIYWGCGQSVFGIKPKRPLKSLIIQAENDLGDTAEQLQGVFAGINSLGDLQLNSESRRGLIEQNVVIVRLPSCTGAKFLELMEALIKLHRPDFVWIDPLFAFAGCDLCDQEKVSAFIREGIIGSAVRNKVCIHIIHHIGKPQREGDTKKGWNDVDYQYLGFGSSEVQNAFRAVNILLPVSGHEGVFRLILSKRGARAGAKDPDGNHTNSIYLTHSKEGISWLQVDKPEDNEQSKPGPGQFKSTYKAADILSEMSASDPIQAGVLCRRIMGETGMSRGTFYRLFEDLKKQQKVRVDGDGWIISNTQ